MTMTLPGPSHATATGVPSDQEEVDDVARRMELEKRVDLYLSGLHCSTWGRNFSVHDKQSRVDAVAFITDLIRGVEAVDLEERIGEPDPV